MQGHRGPLQRVCGDLPGIQNSGPEGRIPTSLTIIKCSLSTCRGCPGARGEGDPGARQQTPACGVGCGIQRKEPLAAVWRGQPLRSALQDGSVFPAALGMGQCREMTVVWAGIGGNGVA